MSHQSLKDLVDVTGTPTDGQVLKYIAGSTSWSPADESGGGGSNSIEYLEIYERGSDLEGKRNALLYAPSSQIQKNTISTSDIDAKSNISGSYTFDSWWEDDVYFIKPSSSAKYILEARIVVRQNDSSRTLRTCKLGYVSSSTSGYNNPTSGSTYNWTFPKIVSFTESNNNRGAVTTAGKYTDMTIVWTFDAHSSEAITPVFHQTIGSSGGVGGFVNTAAGAYSFSKFYTHLRHIKLTKVA